MTCPGGSEGWLLRSLLGFTRTVDIIRLPTGSIPDENHCNSFVPNGQVQFRTEMASGCRSTRATTRGIMVRPREQTTRI